MGLCSGPVGERSLPFSAPSSNQLGHLQEVFSLHLSFLFHSKTFLGIYSFPQYSSVGCLPPTRSSRFCARPWTVTPTTNYPTTTNLERHSLEGQSWDLNAGPNLEPILFLSMVSCLGRHARPKADVQADFETSWETMGWGCGCGQGKSRC